MIVELCGPMTRKHTYFEEATRYLAFAEEIIQNCPVNENLGTYRNIVRVKLAGGIAFLGAELAAKRLIQINLGERVITSEEIKDALYEIDKEVHYNYTVCNQTLLKHIYRFDDAMVSHMAEGLAYAKSVILSLRHDCTVHDFNVDSFLNYPNHIPIINNERENFIADDRFPQHDSYAFCTHCGDFFTYHCEADEGLLLGCPDCDKLAPFTEL